MLTERQRKAVVVALPLLIVGILVFGTQSLRAPVPAEQYQQCLNEAQKDRSKNTECKTDETIWQRTISDPIAYYTFWITVFTAALAGIGLIQGYLLNQQIRLARDEYSATHRPKIIVSGFQIVSNPELESPEKVAFIFTGRNVGDSPAKILEIRSATLVLRAKEKIPGDLSFSFKEKFNITLISQERELFPGNGGSLLEGNEPMEIYVGDKVLLCLGSIAYLGESGRKRETGFCRRYRSREREWDTISESEYEYAY